MAVAVAMASCVKPEEVMVENLESFQVRSMSGSLINVDAGLKVTNLSGSKLMLKDATLVINQNGRKIMEVMLTDKVVVPRRSSAVYTLPLVIRFDGLGGLLGIGTAFSAGMKDCTVSMEATVRGGWAQKKIRIDDIPAETLLREVGIDPAVLMKQYQIQ